MFQHILPWLGNWCWCLTFRWMRCFRFISCDCVGALFGCHEGAFSLYGKLKIKTFPDKKIKLCVFSQLNSHIGGRKTFPSCLLLHFWIWGKSGMYQNNIQIFHSSRCVGALYIEFSEENIFSPQYFLDGRCRWFGGKLTKRIFQLCVENIKNFPFFRKLWVENSGFSQKLSD